DLDAVYLELSKAKQSFDLPFVLPLRRIETYLGHFDRKRSDVARSLGVGQLTYARARLEVSLAEWNLITTALDAQPSSLSALYGTTRSEERRVGKRCGE